MNDLLAGILGALLATNAPIAVSNAVQQTTGIALSVPDRNDPVEQEYQRLLEADDDAQTAVDEMIQQSSRQRVTGDDSSAATVRARIDEKFGPIRKKYEDFLLRHPDHVRARLAYGSFLNDIGEEEAGAEQWDRARRLEPTNPAAWNNLANYYGHRGPVTNAFTCYAKAIELNPREAVYYQNLATTVFLFRRDATNFYGISEPQVFEKAMALYRKAMECDPANFHIATDYAQSYYGINPPKTGNAEEDRTAARKFYDDGVAAWRQAQMLARDDMEREGINLHFARLQINAGRFAEARASLDAVTNSFYAGTKKNLEKKLARLTGKDTGTNAAPGVAGPKK